MRLGFENNLKKYAETIKESLKDVSKEGRLVAAAERDRVTLETAQESFTDLDAEREIFKLQKSKLERTKKFKALLEKTRGPDGSFVHPEINPQLSKVIYENGAYRVVSPTGTESRVTLGDIMTDHEWGIEYTFDPSVDIHTIRNYYLEQLKGNLRKKLDEQIIVSETHFTRGDSFKQEAYKKIKEQMGAPLEQGGVIAEKMVKNFLKKISIDEHADFEIIDADVFQDVENKADFIIRRKNADRANMAQVTESDSIAKPTFDYVGVQFTINTDERKQEQKARQIENSKRKLMDIQDLVLVTLPSHNASKLYQQWVATRTPGGPEKAWDAETGEAIFRGVMSKVLSEAEVDEWCEKHFKK